MTQHLLPFALDYASRYGWAVHPVNINKKPTTAHGFKDATTDETTIRQFFKNGAQLSVRTGAASGLFVLDLDEDPDKGYSVAQTLAMLTERYGPLPHTPHQRTGRGGLQYFFKYQDGLRNKAGTLIGPGIDTRGEGGYAVVAPSRNTNGTYAWIVSPDDAPLADVPAWLLELMTAKPARTAVRPAAPATRNLAPYIDRAFRDEVANVATAPDGTKHDTLRDAAIKLGTLVAHGLDERVIEDALYNAISGRADDPDNALRTIQDGIAYGKDRPREIPERTTPAEPAVEPTFDAHGHACCPNCDRRLKKAKNGNGWRCVRKGGELCSWWPGEGYTPPAKPQKPTAAPETAGGATSQQIITQLSELGYAFRLNDCDDSIEVNDRLIDDITRAQLRMQARDHHIEPLAALEDAYISEAARHRYHPIHDYLNSLQWDGADHIGQLAALLQSSDAPIRYPDGSTAPLHAVYLRRWLIGAVAKALARQQNLLLVWAGPQGIGKSALVRWLCGGLPELFVEAPINPNDKDSDVRLIGRFIWEVSELDATTRRADVAAIKAFITKDQVVVRKAYGRHDTVKPAVASFIGTVNESTGFLSDESGSRRFLVTTITAIDWSYTAIDVNQVWAQAVALYHAGEPWRLLPCEIVHQQVANRRHEVESVLEGWIQKYFHVGAEYDSRMTAADVVDHLRRYDIRLSGNERAQAMELSRVLLRLGAEKVRTNSWRGYHGIMPRAVPGDNLGDNLDEEVVTENSASQGPGDNVTTCDDLNPSEYNGCAPSHTPVSSALSTPISSALSTPISSIDKRLSQVVTTPEEGSRTPEATVTTSTLEVVTGCHEVVTPTAEGIVDRIRAAKAQRDAV